MTDTRSSQRIAALDLLRSAALLGMASYHFVYDLQMHGLVPPGFAVQGFFYWHARTVASTFLLLAGLGIWLSHGAGIRWPAFWRRMAKVGGAAALVSVTTYIALPDWWIFFGILHCIALGSLLALPFLRLPALVTLAAGAFVVWASYALATPAMNAPLLRFIGLHTIPTMTVDFEPLFPWFGPILIGLGLGRLGSAFGLWDWLRRWNAPAWLRALGWPGRHSLAVYLLHQPILFGLVGLWAWTVR